MKLFVDDIRPCPAGEDYICCRDYDSAVWELCRRDFDYVSLDYDLGYGASTGLDLLIWMKNNGKFAPHINIHSSHPLGRSRMKKFCEDNFPNTLVTMHYAN